MNQEKMYSLIPIYSTSATWIAWGIFVHFHDLHSVLACLSVTAIQGVLMAKAFPPKLIYREGKHQTIQDSDQVGESYEDWNELIGLTDNMLKRYHGTQLEIFLKKLRENILHIDNAISAFPERQKRPYVRRFREAYIEICKGKDLIAYSRFPRPAGP